MLVCPNDGLRYPLKDGIWRLLEPQRAVELEPFIKGYQEQRAKEGWGTPQPDEYYLQLPYKDTTGRHTDLWELRSSHMGQMLMWLEPVFDGWEHPVIVDAGAGNCWLSYRLAEEEALPIALDINDDNADGLGVVEVYRRESWAGPAITAAQAELEKLPLADESCHAVVINGSLHYTEHPGVALQEGWRVLVPGGKLAAIVYSSPERNPIFSLLAPIVWQHTGARPRPRR